MRRPITPRNEYPEKLPGRRGPGLCMHPGYGQPLPVSPRPLSGPALPAAPRCMVVLSRAQFDTEGTTQLPPGSPREQNRLSVCQRPPPSARPPPAALLPAKGKWRGSQAHALWEPQGWCANELSPAPGQSLGTWNTAATLWQTASSRLSRGPLQTRRGGNTGPCCKLMTATGAKARETENRSGG